MRSRFTLRMQIAILLVLSSIIIGAINYSHMSLEGELKVEQVNISQLKQLMESLQPSINVLLRQENKDVVGAILNAMVKNTDIKLALIVSDTGKVLLASHVENLNKNIMEVSSNFTISQLSSVNDIAEKNISISVDRNYVSAIYPLDISGSIVSLVVENDLTQDKKLEQEIINNNLFMILFFMFCAIVIIWLVLSLIINQRVNRLLEFANNIASGNLFAKSGLEGRDEFSKIGQALDVMTESLYSQQYKLAMSEERLEKSQQFAHMGSWDWIIETDKIYWSEPIALLLGLDSKKTEVDYDYFMSFVHPDDKKNVEKNIQACLHDHKPFNVQHRIIKPDGTVRWMQGQGDVERDESGVSTRMIGIIRDITEQKEADIKYEKVLQDLNYQKDALDQHSIVGITDVNGKIIYANKKFSEISGYSHDELVGKDHSILKSGHHSKEFYMEMWATIAAGGKWQGEICNKKKNGDIYWVDTTIVPHLDENGKPDQYTAIRTDITDRILIRESVSKERQLLTSINDIQLEFLSESEPMVGFSHLLDVLLSVSESEYGFIGEILFTDEQKPYLKFLSLSNFVRDAENQKLYDKSGMEFTNLDTLFGRAITTGLPVISNQPENDLDSGGLPEGHMPLNAFLGIPLYVGNQLIGLIGVANKTGGYNQTLIDDFQPLFTTCARIIETFKNEKERNHAVTELARFKSTLDQTKDCVYIIDPDTLKFTYVNQGAVDQIGYSREEFLNMTLDELDPSYGEADFGEILSSLIKGPIHTENFEFQHQCKDGSHIPVDMFLQYVFPIDEPPRFVAFAHSVAERKQLQNQLRQAQKMESIGQLTGGIAHDFNNMLASIMGYTELSIERLDNNSNDHQLNTDKIKIYLGEVLKSGLRARDLVEQMLAFSRGGEGKLSLYSIATLIKESLKMLGNTLPASIEIDFDFDDEQLKVLTHPVQLHQIIMNLCINARDAMQEQGHITIGLRQVNQIKQECFSCHQMIDGDFIELSVRDSGCGISESDMESIFDPFYTTKAVGKGSGMGLSMVHGIMHDHQGHIIVESDNGTTFKLLFPIPSGQENIVSLVKTKEFVNVENSFTGNILVVDDDVSVGNLISEILLACGCQVTQETDSNNALKTFKEDPTKFDLLVTDQTMPGLLGTDLTQLVKAIRPDLPVVLCTGFSEQIDENKANEFGIDMFLNKPVVTVEFVAIIEELLIDHSKNIMIN